MKTLPPRTNPARYILALRNKPYVISSVTHDFVTYPNVPTHFLLIVHRLFIKSQWSLNRVRGTVYFASWAGFRYCKRNKLTVQMIWFFNSTRCCFFPLMSVEGGITLFTVGVRSGNKHEEVCKPRQRCQIWLKSRCYFQTVLTRRVYDPVYYLPQTFREW